MIGVGVPIDVFLQGEGSEYDASSTESDDVYGLSDDVTVHALVKELNDG
jgi:hypothetical protein